MSYSCSVCGHRVEGDVLVFIDHTEQHIVNELKSKNPNWQEKDGLCPGCLEYLRKEIKGN